MPFYTNKKPSNLGLASKKGATDATPRIVAPTETFEADADEVPQSWIDLGWVAPATKDEEAAARDRKTQSEKTKPDADPANPLNTQGAVAPAPAPSTDAEQQRARPASNMEQQPEGEQHHSSRRNRT